jgi:cap1 methyltransferase
MYAKEKLSGIPPELFDVARSRANPYEAIGKSIFLNRAAVKLANMDDLFGLTKVKLRQVIVNFH